MRNLSYYCESEATVEGELELPLAMVSAGEGRRLRLEQERNVEQVVRGSRSVDDYRHHTPQSRKSARVKTSEMAVLAMMMGWG